MFEYFDETEDGLFAASDEQVTAWLDEHAPANILAAIKQRDDKETT